MLNIKTKCRAGTCCNESRKLDRELSDVLIAISVISRRIADRIAQVGSEENCNAKGGNLNGKNKRVVNSH